MSATKIFSTKSCQEVRISTLARSLTVCVSPLRARSTYQGCSWQKKVELLSYSKFSYRQLSRTVVGISAHLTALQWELRVVPKCSRHQDTFKLDEQLLWETPERIKKFFFLSGRVFYHGGRSRWVPNDIIFQRRLRKIRLHRRPSVHFSWSVAWLSLSLQTHCGALIIPKHDYSD